MDYSTCGREEASNTKKARGWGNVVEVAAVALAATVKEEG